MSSNLPDDFAGALTIAVCTLVNNTDTLQWILSDHLGSANTTANKDGSWNSTIQYTAYGEIRLTKGITPTKYRYTGQLAQAELGLDYYFARWYDPVTGHFTSADTIVPEPGNASAFDRYGYVSNNPMRYNDPSGHDVGCAGRDASECNKLNTLKKNIDKTKRENVQKKEKNRITKLEKFQENFTNTRDAQTPYSEKIKKSIPGSSEDWERISIALDVTTEVIDAYAVAVVIAGGVIGAGVTSPALLSGAPEVPAVTGALGAAIAEIYVQKLLQTGNFIATGSTVSIFISDTKSNKTIIDTGKIANTTSNSLVFAALGWQAPEAIISFTFQTTVLLNDFGVTSVPFQN